MLILKRNLGEEVAIGRAVVRIHRVHPQRRSVWLGIQAPGGIPVHRLDREEFREAFEEGRDVNLDRLAQSLADLVREKLGQGRIRQLDAADFREVIEDWMGG